MDRNRNSGNCIFSLTMADAGDPWGKSLHANNTKIVEIAVLNCFAEMWHIQWPHNPADKDTFWGYLTNSSTEGIKARREKGEVLTRSYVAIEFGVQQAKQYLKGELPIDDNTNKLMVTNVRGKYLHKYIDMYQNLL